MMDNIFTPAELAQQNQVPVDNSFMVKYGNEMVNAAQLLDILRGVNDKLVQAQGVCSRLDMNNVELNRQREVLSAQNVELSRQNDALSAQLEAPDLSRLIQGLVRAEVEQQTEKYLESHEFQRQLDNRLEDLLDDALKNTSPDVGEAVEKAIEEALGNVRITFRN